MINVKGLEFAEKEETYLLASALHNTPPKEPCEITYRALYQLDHENPTVNFDEMDYFNYWLEEEGIERDSFATIKMEVQPNHTFLIEVMVNMPDCIR